MNDEFVLSDKDVVSLSNPPTSRLDTCKVKDLMEYLSSSPPSGLLDFFKQGKECEVLKIGASDWHKGKLRVRMELVFIPEESEEPNEPEIQNICDL